MNPFLGQGSDRNSLSGAARHGSPAPVANGIDSTTDVTAAAAMSSSSDVMQQQQAAAGSSRESSQHRRQQGEADSAPAGRSDPSGSSFATARSESRSSISGSEAPDVDSRGTDADQALMQQSQQQRPPWRLTAAAGSDSDSDTAAPPAEKASSQAVCCPATLPGLSEIEPADLSPRTSAQQDAGTVTPGNWRSAGTSAAREQQTGPPVQHKREPSLGELLFGCGAAAPAAAAGAEAAAQPEAGAAAGRADCWFEDLDDEQPYRDDSNPFLVQDAKPAPTQHSTARQPAVTLSPVCEDGMPDTCSPAGGPYTHLAAEPSSAAYGRSAASTPGPAGGLSGPLTSSRSQLLRPSSAASWRATALSDPAVTAAATAQLAGCRRRPGPQSGAWEKLPGQVASLSYAKTASLKTNPLPALAAVASGQPRKQQGPTEAQEPGVLTLNATQLPQRPVSESSFCVRSVQGYGYGYGRYPGLRAEESNASAAAALQQLSVQQANNQELIQRLLHGPAPTAEASAPTAGRAGAAGQGFTAAGPQDVAAYEFNQGPGRSYAGYGNRGGYGGYSGVQQGPDVLGVQAAAAAARGAMLGPEHSVLLVQQQPQLFAQYSSSGGGSFLAPVPVAVAGWAGGTAPQQGQQLLLLSGQGYAPAAGAAGAAVVTAGSLQLSEPLPGLQQQHQVWQGQNISSRSAQMQEHAARMGFTSVSAQHSREYVNCSSAWAAQGAGGAGGSGMPAAQGGYSGLQESRSYLLQQRSAASLGMAPSPGGLSCAQSCIELGTRAADVGNIVLRAKAKAAAKQQLLQQQQQQAQELQVTPKTPLLGSSVLDALAGGQQLKGAAAMLVGKPARPAAGRAHAPASAQPQHPTVISNRKDQRGSSAAATCGPAGAAVRGASAAAAAAAAAAVPAPRNSLAAAVRDGDKVLQMLQEYKELTELDKAVKSRMRELLHTAAVPGSAATSLPSSSTAIAAVLAPANPAASAGFAASAGQTQHPISAPRAAAAAAAAAGMHGDKVRLVQQPRPAVTANSAAQPPMSEAAGVPRVHETSSTAEAAGNTGPADAHVQGGVSHDQAAAAQDVEECHQHRDSPAKAAGQQPHSDQQQKLAGLHRSPNPKTARAAAAAAAAGGSLGGTVTDADVSAAKRKAARQLWQPSSSAASGSAANSKGVGGVPGASAAAGGDPTARVLAAAGLAAGSQVPGVVQKGKGRGSVAALVAALAGRKTK